jgi:DNA-directed RNA polymerase subunit RPC12/RpoP
MKYGIAAIPPGQVCALCPKPATDIDHCHITQKPRGFLCRYCNVRIGVLEQTEFVIKARRYLAGKVVPLLTSPVNVSSLIEEELRRIE